jgi:hypothetical protein
MDRATNGGEGAEATRSQLGEARHVLQFPLLLDQYQAARFRALFQSQLHP